MKNYYKNRVKTNYPKVMSVQELTGQKKTGRIDKRTYEAMPELLKELARISGIDETEVINKLLIYALIKKGLLKGTLKKIDTAWHGSVKDMPLKAEWMK